MEVVDIANPNQQLKLTLDLPDSVNSIYGRNKFGSTYLKKKGKDYKEKMIKYIKVEVAKQGWIKPSDTFLYLDEVVYMNRMGRDPDNLKKLQQDCITESGVVWEDDQYSLPRTRRVYIDAYNPRIDVVISEAQFIGVFDNQEHLDKFMIQCKQCKRLKNNCSILRKLTENRIHKDVNSDFVCSKYNPI